MHMCYAVCCKVVCYRHGTDVQLLAACKHWLCPSLHTVRASGALSVKVKQERNMHNADYNVSLHDTGQSTNACTIRMTTILHY